MKNQALASDAGQHYENVMVLQSDAGGDDFISDMRDKLASYVAEAKRPQARIARELNVSQTRLSQFLNGTYPGNNEALAKAVQQFLTLGAVRKVLAQAPDICLEVSNTKRLLREIHNAHVAGEILLIYGPAGCSKTTTLQYYATNNGGVIYIQADVTMNSPRAILLAILDELGEDQRGTTNVLMRRLISLLKDTKRLIIIDEAQHLTEKSFDAIRALNDKAGVGLVYAGNPKILKQMYGRRAEDFDQLHSRVGCHCELSNNYKLSDIAAIFSGQGLDKECLDYLYKASRRKGGLRVMTKQYKIAANIAIAVEQPLSVAHLEDAARRMGIA